MPVTIIYTDEPYGVIGVFTGNVTGEDIVAFNNEVAGCKECKYQLTDYRAANSIQVTPKELHKIAIQDASIPQDYEISKMAMVGDTEKYSDQIKTYFLFLDHWIGKRRDFESKAFSSMDEACEWLGLPPDSDLTIPRI